MIALRSVVSARGVGVLTPVNVGESNLARQTRGIPARGVKGRAELSAESDGQMFAAKMTPAAMSEQSPKAMDVRFASVC